MVDDKVLLMAHLRAQSRPSAPEVPVRVLGHRADIGLTRAQAAARELQRDGAIQLRVTDLGELRARLPAGELLRSYFTVPPMTVADRARRANLDPDRHALRALCAEHPQLAATLPAALLFLLSGSPSRAMPDPAVLDVLEGADRCALVQLLCALHPSPLPARELAELVTAAVSPRQH